MEPSAPQRAFRSPQGAAERALIGIPGSVSRLSAKPLERKITLVTIPNSHPRIAVTRMIQTSDWRVDPNTKLTLTVRVLAATRAIRITSATRAPAQV